MTVYINYSWVYAEDPQLVTVYKFPTGRWAINPSVMKTL